MFVMTMSVGDALLLAIALVVVTAYAIARWRTARQDREARRRLLDIYAEDCERVRREGKP